jgi:hypothetical protein
LTRLDQLGVHAGEAVAVLVDHDAHPWVCEQAVPVGPESYVPYP